MSLLEAYNLELFIAKVLPKTSGRLGFILAKNKRLLSEELIEYKQKRVELFARYGEKKGNSYIINTKTSNFQFYMTEMSKYNEIECNPNLLKVSEADLCNSELSGEEIAILLEVL